MAGNTLLGGGEAGREAVLPLDSNTGWMDRLADKVASRVASDSGGSNQPIRVQVVLDGRVVAESTVHLLLSLALAVLLLLLAKDTVEELVGAPLAVLLTTGSNVWVIVTTCIVVLLVTGLVPGYIYTHVPVAAAFKHYRQSYRLWKLLLLGLQFASATFLIVLLIVVGRQYRMMVNDNPGYDYATLGSVLKDGVSSEQCQLAMEELRKLSCVKGVTMAYANLTEHQSGDNIYLPGSERENMNIITFGENIDYDTKIDTIKERLTEYAREIIPQQKIEPTNE
jgi:hypothetical protein